MKLSKAYARQVFLNCPFDDAYRPIYEAIIFAVIHCGFVIRCAREREDSGEPRISKIQEIIRASKFGIHDISRVELDPANGLPRFNMPLELGLFLGAKAYSTESEQREKRCLILDTEPFRYQKFISDIAGQDIRDHGGIARKALVHTRNWLASVSKRQLPGPLEIERWYDEFRDKEPPHSCGGSGRAAHKCVPRGLCMDVPSSQRQECRCSLTGIIGAKLVGRLMTAPWSGSTLSRTTRLDGVTRASLRTATDIVSEPGKPITMSVAKVSGKPVARPKKPPEIGGI